MNNLFATILGNKILGAEDGNKNIRLFDAIVNLFEPICCKWNIFPIDPNIALVRIERIVQSMDKFLVFA
jgi:hypothetical protein